MLQQKARELIEMSVMVDVKKGVLYFNDLDVSCKFKTKAWVKIPDSAWITPGKAGFEALHEKIALLAKVHKFDMDALINAIATTSVVRRVYMTRDCGVPPYIAIMIQKMMQESKACIGSTGMLRKTTEYVMFLRNIVEMKQTLPTVTSNASVRRYYIPEDANEMGVEQLLLEIEAAEAKGAKKPIIERLRRYLRNAQQAQQTTTKTGRKKTEFEQFKEAIDEVAAEDKADRIKAHGSGDVEYDDMPSTKKKKKRRK